MLAASESRIVSVAVHAVLIPLPEPHQTASGTVAASPLVLTELRTSDGVVGSSIIFTYTPMALKPTADLVTNFAPLIIGELLAPSAIERKLGRRFRLLGTQGLVGMALAAIDMALWDALARCLTPTTHWLEYADWWNSVLREPLTIRDGFAIPADALGTGIAFDPAAITRYAA